MMMEDESHKFGRSGNHISSQIYLTFPAESTFTDEDVTKYFSQFGPVQDVRIPYQQKRMFGFVTFVYPETVKHILTKGNPHFICESRVLVKPYKEKGNEDKKHNHHQQQQQFELRELPGGPSPGEPYGVHIGPRKFINDQGLMLRRLEEQTILQHRIIEAQARRMMDLQLQNEIRNHHHVNQYPQDHSLIDPRDSHIPAFLQMNQNLIPEGPKDYLPAFADQQVQHRVNGMHNGTNGGENHYVKEASLSEFDLRSQQIQNGANGMHNGTNGGGNRHVNESPSEFDLGLEHLLPDDLFSSPKKHSAYGTTVFSNSFPPQEADESVGPQILGSVEMPRLSSGHDDAIEEM